MDIKKLKVIFCTATLMMGSYYGVQEFMNHRDLKASELVKQQIMNNSENVSVEQESKYLAKSEKSSYNNCKRLVIFTEDFNPDTIMIFGKGKYKNDDVDFTIYGSVDNAQKVTVNGQEIGEAVYMQKFGKTVKVNLGKLGLEIVEAECVITGK